MGSNVPPGSLTTDPRPEAERDASEPSEAASSPGRLRELAQVVLIAVIAALFVRTFLVQAFVVPSGSMEPTVLVGDHLLVNKFLYAPHGPLLSALLPYRRVRRGDVIVFKFPEDPTRDFIKRAVALPGDVVEVRDKTVLVNGSIEARSAARRPGGLDSELRPAPGDWLAPLRVAADKYFAMGDNRDSSYDSRFWGPVPAGNLKGRALFIYWSLAPDPTSSSGGGVHRLLGIPGSTRWNRTFRLVR